MQPRRPDVRTPAGSPAGYPSFRSHLIPRTRTGKIVAGVFLVLFALTEPPAVFLVANRIAPWIAGLPFLYAYLLGLYLALIAVLLIALRRGL